MSVARIVPGLEKASPVPRAGEGRTALPFPDPWVLVATLLLLSVRRLPADLADSASGWWALNISSNLVSLALRSSTFTAGGSACWAMSKGVTVR